MKLPKEFDYYLRKGIVRKINASEPRAKFLMKESKISFEGLKERVQLIGVNEKNTNSIIKDCYDIIMEVIRAKLFLIGYAASGNYAHEAEISYLKNLGFLEKDISFINELRYFRNSAVYYGKILNKEYAEGVVNFLEGIYYKLIDEGKNV